METSSTDFDISKSFVVSCKLRTFDYVSNTDVQLTMIEEFNGILKTISMKISMKKFN